MSRITLAAPAVCLFLFSSPAPAAENVVTHKKVQTYLDLAADLFKSGDYEGALVELQRAESLTDLAVVRFNVARCLDELHREGDAYAAYDKYLALQDTTEGAADRHRRAKDALVRLGPAAKPTVSAMPPPPPPASRAEFGTLEVSCPTPRTTVFVAGLMQTPDACPWKSSHVPVGSYDIQTTPPGGAPSVTRARVARGKVTAVLSPAAPTPEAAPLPQPPLPPAMTVATDAARPASVRFVPAREGDGYTVTVPSAAGKTCAAPCELDLPRGKHRVTISGAASYQADIEVADDSVSVARIERRKGGWLALGITSLIVGSVALAVGAEVFVLGLAPDADGNSDKDAQITGLAIMGSGIVVGIVGSIVGFKLKGGNRITVEHPGRTAEGPELMAIGIAPMPRGGAIAGATFRF